MFLGILWVILCRKRQRMPLGKLRAMLWEKFGECQGNSLEGAPRNASGNASGNSTKH